MISQLTMMRMGIWLALWKLDRSNRWLITTPPSSAVCMALLCKHSVKFDVKAEFLASSDRPDGNTRGASGKMIFIPLPIIRRRRLCAQFLHFLTNLVLCHVLNTAFGSSKSGELTEKSGNGIPAPISVVEEIPAIRQDTGGSDSTERDCQGQDEVIMTPKGQIQKWLGDPECENFTIQFAPQRTFEPRALVSFPRSGNTWLRHLIESSTGYFTGSVFSDKKLLKSGFLGETREPNDGTTIVQKTHHHSNSSPSKSMRSFQSDIRREIKKSKLFFEYRGILVIRNPFNALISYWNFRTTKSFMKSRKEPGFDTLTWKNFVQPRAPLWADLILDWIEKSPDLLVVLYEDLTLDTEKELRRILAYLKQSIDPNRLKCTMKYSEGSFHRKPGKERTGGTTGLCPFKDNKIGNTTLELIVQNNIKRVNSFLLGNGFPLQLNYTAPPCH